MKTKTMIAVAICAIALYLDRGLIWSSQATTQTTGSTSTHQQQTTQAKKAKDTVTLTVALEPSFAP